LSDEEEKDISQSDQVLETERCLKNTTMSKRRNMFKAGKETKQMLYRVPVFFFGQALR